MAVIDQREIYERGLRDPDSLDRFELFVFLVTDLETYMYMEGWDAFFLHYRPDDVEHVCKMLRWAEDSTSLEVIDHYADRLRSRGLAFPPAELTREWCESSEKNRDWCEDFSNATEERWRLIGELLRRQGYELAGPSPSELAE